MSNATQASIPAVFPAQVLMHMPLQGMHAQIRHQELEWHVRHSTSSAAVLFSQWRRERDELNPHEPLPPVTRMVPAEIVGSAVQWKVSVMCRHCEGHGSLFTLSGKYASECGPCEGSGADPFLSVVFTTDADVNEILEIRERGI